VFTRAASRNVSGREWPTSTSSDLKALPAVQIRLRLVPVLRCILFYLLLVVPDLSKELCSFRMQGTWTVWCRKHRETIQRLLRKGFTKNCLCHRGEQMQEMFHSILIVFCEIGLSCILKRRCLFSSEDRA
jgi:hypothetical protein